MTALDAAGIIATDLARTLELFRLLGLDVPEVEETEGHVEIEVAEGFRIMIDTVATVESFSQYQPAAGGRNVGFAVRCSNTAEVDEIFQRVSAAGYQHREAPFDAFWGQRYATVLDPDGNPFDLYAALD